jgi:hypothetical protein
MQKLANLLFASTVAALLALSFTSDRASSVAAFNSIQLPVRSAYSTLVTVTITDTSASLTSRNPSRNYALIQNKGSATIYCKIEGTAPTATTSDIEIAPGGNWEPNVIPVDAIACIAASGNNWTAFVEGTPN